MWRQLDTVKDLAGFLEVTPNTVRKWIRSGALRAEKRGSKYYILERENSEFVLKKLAEKHARPYSPFVPKEIETYEKWHTVLDEFCWLLKVTYASRNDLKARRFRLDTLLATYLQSNASDINNICRLLGKKPVSGATVSADLRRGWYNELAFLFPLKTNTLGLTFEDINHNRRASAD